MASATAVAASCPLCGGSERSSIWTEDGYDIVRCRSCGLVAVANPPAPEELDRLYSRGAGYHEAFYDDEREIARRLRAGRRNLRFVTRHRDRGRLLDVGCSAGFFLKAASDRGFTVRGIELSPDTAELGRLRYGLYIHAGTLDDHPFEPGSFDVVTMWDLIEHVRDPVRAMSEVARLLAPGGIVALVTPNVDGLFPRLSHRLAATTGFWPHPEPPAHLFQFSKRTLDRLLRTAGLEPVEVRDRHIALTYSIGSPAVLRRSPRRLAYAAAFAPAIYLGPLAGAGDKTVAVARKPQRAPPGAAGGG